MSAETGALFLPPSRRTFPKLDYDTEPKIASKAREIGSEQETGNEGEQRRIVRIIYLDVERRSDHDGTTPEARSQTVERWVFTPGHAVSQMAPQPRPSIKRRLATSKVDAWTRPPRQWCRLICKSELDREANRQRCRRGAR